MGCAEQTAPTALRVTVSARADALSVGIAAQPASGLHVARLDEAVTALRALIGELAAGLRVQGSVGEGHGDGPFGDLAGYAKIPMGPGR